MADHPIDILLRAKDQASKQIRGVNNELSRTGSIANRASKGLGTAATNITRTAVVGIGLLGVAIKTGIDTLAEREDLLSASAQAIKNAGLNASVSAPQVAAFSQALEAATGAAVDDKAIQQAANTIITFGRVSADNYQRATTAAVDLGAAMKTGPEEASKMLAKALADPAKGMTALRRAGVVLTKSEEDRIKALVKANKLNEAQAELLTAVEAKTKGAAAASAGPYRRSMNLIADVAEDARAALAEGFLPVITRVADALSTKLAQPGTMDEIRNAGKFLADSFDRVLDAAGRVPWASIGDAMKLGGQGAKAALDLFTGMPPWVQTAVLTGWGLDKLTGGAVSGIVGELGKGLIKGVLGMNAGVVNLRAGVVNGGGGVGGGAVGGGGGKLGAIAGIASKVFIVGAAAGVAAELWGVKEQQTQANLVQGNQLGIQTSSFAMGASAGEIVNALKGIKEQQVRLNSELTPEAIAYQLNIDGVRTRLDSVVSTLEARLRSMESSTLVEFRSGERATATGLANVKNAINAKDYSVSVTVPVSLTTYVSNKSITNGQKTVASFGQQGHL